MKLKTRKKPKNILSIYVFVNNFICTAVSVLFRLFYAFDNWSIFNRNSLSIVFYELYLVVGLFKQKIIFSKLKSFDAMIKEEGFMRGIGPYIWVAYTT